MQAVFDSDHCEGLAQFVEDLTDLLLVTCAFRPQQIRHIEGDQFELLVGLADVHDQLFEVLGCHAGDWFR